MHRWKRPLEKIIGEPAEKKQAKPTVDPRRDPRHIIHDERSEMADSSAPIRFVMPEESESGIPHRFVEQTAHVVVKENKKKVFAVAKDIQNATSRLGRGRSILTLEVRNCVSTKLFQGPLCPLSPGTGPLDRAGGLGLRSSVALRIAAVLAILLVLRRASTALALELATTAPTIVVVPPVVLGPLDSTILALGLLLALSSIRDGSWDVLGSLINV